MKKVLLSAFTFVMLSTISAQAQTAQTAQAPAATQTQNPAARNNQPATQTATDTNTQAASQTNTAAATPAATEETKTLITVAELPEEVKTTLASPTLKVWTAYEAYLIKEADGKEYYAINIRKDTQTGSVRLDKEGKPVK